MTPTKNTARPLATRETRHRSPMIARTNPRITSSSDSYIGIRQVQRVEVGVAFPHMQPPHVGFLSHPALLPEQGGCVIAQPFRQGPQLPRESDGLSAPNTSRTIPANRNSDPRRLNIELLLKNPLKNREPFAQPPPDRTVCRTTTSNKRVESSATITPILFVPPASGQEYSTVISRRPRAGIDNGNLSDVRKHPQSEVTPTTRTIWCVRFASVIGIDSRLPATQVRSTRAGVTTTVKYVCHSKTSKPITTIPAAANVVIPVRIPSVGTGSSSIGAVSSAPDMMQSVLTFCR